MEAWHRKFGGKVYECIGMECGDICTAVNEYQRAFTAKKACHYQKDKMTSTANIGFSFQTAQCLLSGLMYKAVMETRIGDRHELITTDFSSKQIW